MEASRRRFLGLTLASGGVLILPEVLAACGVKNAGSASGSGSGSGSGTITLGALSGFTGDFAPWGLQYRSTMELGAKMVNDGTLNKWVDIVLPSGGLKIGGKVYKLAVDSADTQADPSVSVNAARKLVTEDVKYILGPIGETTATVAANQFYASDHVLSLTMSNTWASQGPQWPLSFNIMTDMEDYWQNVYMWLTSTRKEVKRIAVVTTDQTYGQLGVNIANKWAAQTKAFEIVYQSVFPTTTTDYNPIVTAALAKNPDLIDIGGAADPDAFAGIMAAAYQQGFKGTVGSDGLAVKFTATSYADDVVLAKVPNSYFDGAVQGYPTASWGVTKDGPTPEAVWLYNQSIASGNQASEWNTVSPTGYYALRVWLEGVKAADSLDPQKIATALQALSPISTPMGNATWTGKELSGVNRALLIPERVLQRQKGQWVIAATTSPPFPWNYDFAPYPYGSEFKPNANV